jgi:hypothetical protein
MVTPRLPALTQNWQLDTNNPAAVGESELVNNRKTLFAIKDSFVNFSSNPWIVNSSSDSVAAATADLWIDFNDLIWSTGNHSWIVLEKPTTGSQLLISLDVTSSRDMLISWSPTGVYTGGSISVDPTASDQITLQASGEWNGNLSVYNSRVHVWHTEDGSRTRVVVTNDVQGPSLFWILDEINPIPDNWATNPEVVYILEGIGAMNFSASGNLPAIPITGNAAKSWNDTSGFDIALFSLGYDSVPSGFGGFNWISRHKMGEKGNVLNDDAPFPMSPIGVISEVTGFRGIHGILADLYVGHQDRPDGTTYPSSTTERLWAQAGDIILPWTGDSTIPLFNITDNTENGVLVGFGASAVVGAAKTFVMIGVDTGAPLLSQPFYHFWTVTGEPDPTGAFAVGSDAPPFGGPLTKIYVSAQFDVIE